MQWFADSVSLLLLTPFYVAFPFPSVISRFTSSRNFGRKKLMSENRDMTQRQFKIAVGGDGEWGKESVLYRTPGSLYYLSYYYSLIYLFP